MLGHVSRGGMVRGDRRGQDEADLILLEEIGGPVSGPGFRPPVGHQLKAEGRPVIVARLLGIPHVKLDVIRPVDWEGIGDGLGGSGGAGMHDPP